MLALFTNLLNLSVVSGFIENAALKVGVNNILSTFKFTKLESKAFHLLLDRNLRLGARFIQSRCDILSCGV